MGGRHVRVGREIGVGMEVRGRIAPFLPAIAIVMGEGVHPGRRDVGVVGEIVGRIEEGVGLAALLPAVGAVVLEGERERIAPTRQGRPGHVRIGEEVVFRVERAVGEGGGLPDGGVGLAPFELPEGQIVGQRVDPGLGHVRIVLQVQLVIEGCGGIAPLLPAVGVVVGQWVDAGPGHVRVGREISGGREERIGIAALLPPVLGVVGHRIQVGAGHIRVVLRVIDRVEEHGSAGTAVGLEPQVAQDRQIDVRDVVARPEGRAVSCHQVGRDRVAGTVAEVVILLAVLLARHMDGPTEDGLGRAAGKIRTAVGVDLDELVPGGFVAVQGPRVVPEPGDAEPVADLVLQDLDRAGLVRGQGRRMRRVGIDEEELVDEGRIDRDDDVRCAAVRIHAGQQFVLGSAAVDAGRSVLADEDRGRGAAVRGADRGRIRDGDLDVDRAEAVEVLRPHGGRGVRIGQERGIVAVIGRVDQGDGAIESHRHARRSNSSVLLARGADEAITSP